MCSPGINGEGELRGQPANPGSRGKMAIKIECVCVHVQHLCKLLCLCWTFRTSRRSTTMHWCWTCSVIGRRSSMSRHLLSTSVLLLLCVFCCLLLQILVNSVFHLWCCFNCYHMTLAPCLPRWLTGLTQCAPTGTVCRRSPGSIPGRPVDFVFGFQGRMLWD